MKFQFISIKYFVNKMYFKFCVVGLSLSAFGQEFPQISASKKTVVLSGLKLSFADSSGNVLNSHSLDSNKPETFSVEKGQIIRYHFIANKGSEQDSEDLEVLKLDQAVALFNHTSTSTLTYAPFGTSKIGSYRLNLGNKNFPKFAQTNPGEYEVTVFASATEDLKPVKFSAGFINFVSAEKAKTVKSQRYGSQPLIHHTFRQPEALPSSFLSLTFSALCLLPWLFLFAAWFNLGANISAFPWNNPGHSLVALGFLVSLSLNIGLAYLYWVELPLFETILYFVPIGISTLVTGRFALGQAQVRRNMTLK